MHVISRVLIMSLLLMLNSGCSYFQFSNESSDPTLSLEDIKLTKANLLHQVFTADIRIENPNDFDLPISGVEIQLSLQDQTLGEGASSQHFVVPAHGSAVFKMKIRTNLLSNLGTIKNILEGKSDDISYRLNGSVDVSFPYLFRDFDFEKIGTLPTSSLRK